MSIDLDAWARALRVKTDADAIAELHRVRFALARAIQDLHFDANKRVDFDLVNDDGIGPAIRCAMHDIDLAISGVISVENAFQRHERGES